MTHSSFGKIGVTTKRKQIPILKQMEEKRFERIEARVAKLEGDVHEIKSDMNQIKSDMSRILLILESGASSSPSVTVGTMAPPPTETSLSPSSAGSGPLAPVPTQTSGSSEGELLDSSSELIPISASPSCTPLSDQVDDEEEGGGEAMAQDDDLH